MQGKAVGNSLVIMDSFALPVQGTETRVNAAAEANEYMVQYIQSSERVRNASLRRAQTLIVYYFQASRLENAVGWYHSHPGFGCWLSNVDINTQQVCFGHLH